MVGLVLNLLVMYGRAGLALWAGWVYVLGSDWLVGLGLVQCW